MTKNKNDVFGYREECPNYSMCPVCYGCRNYDSADMNCEECTKDSKKNICNKERHQYENVSKLISRDTLYIDKGGKNDN